jgi:hypothetical protein
MLFGCLKKIDSNIPNLQNTGWSLQDRKDATEPFTAADPYLQNARHRMLQQMQHQRPLFHRLREMLPIDFLKPR